MIDYSFHERLYLVGCSVYTARRLYGSVLGFVPSQSWDQNPRVLSPSFVSAAMCSESQTPLTPMVSPLGEAQCCDVFHWYSCYLKGGLLP